MSENSQLHKKNQINNNKIENIKKSNKVTFNKDKNAKLFNNSTKINKK